MIKKDLLRTVVESMLILTIVDKDIRPEEMEMIRDLVKKHWKDEFGGNRRTFIKEVAYNLRKENREGATLSQKIRKNAVYLKSMANEKQAAEIIDLMEELIRVDLYIDQRERVLFQEFKEEMEKSNKK